MSTPLPNQSNADQSTTPIGSRLSRRQLMRTAGMLGGGLGIGSLLAACGIAAEDANPEAEGTTPATGGTLTLGVDATSAVNDPAFYTSLGDWMAVDSICRGLTFISFETNEVQPDLAESWELSEDGLTYTFKLRQGVTFHDGTTFTSADVLASLNRQFDDTDPTLPEGASRPLNSLNAKVAAVDEQTVTLTLPAPDATTLARLSDTGGRIISAAALEKYGKDIGKNLVGTGPFKFASATAGQSVILEAFDDFRLGRPPIDRLVLQQVQDPSTIISSLLSGDISATQFTPYSASPQLKADSSVTVYDTPYGMDAIMMMDARKESLAELEVRQAINLAIDRDAILAQAFFGIGALPVGYVIPPSLNGHDPSLADLSAFDPDKARALLESVDAVGRTVHLMAASDSWHPKAAQIVEQNLTDIGLKVVTDSVDPSTYFSRIYNPDDKFHELMIWERNLYVPDPDNMIGSMAAPRGVYGDFATGFATLDGAAAFGDELYKAKNLPDGDERTALYSEIQRNWAENYMVMTMLGYSSNLVVSGATVQGMNTAALGNHRCFMEKASV